MRHGHDASFIDRDGEGTISLEAFVEAESDRLDTTALRQLYEAESGAHRQRRLCEKQGADALCDGLLLQGSE